MNLVPSSALAALSPTKFGFMVSTREIDPQLSGDALKAYLAEMFLPAHLLCKQIADMPSLPMELCNFFAFQRIYASATFVMYVDINVSTRTLSWS